MKCESNASDFTTHDRILFLDYLRAIAIIMVVGVHTLGYCIPLPENQKIIISFVLQSISVPIFFFVDGYLFSRNIELLKKYDYIFTIKRSAHRLLLPWVFFSMFYVLARYFFEISGYTEEKVIIGYSFFEVAISTYGSVIASQMYFLPSLFIIRLLGPIFRKIIIIKNLYILLLLFISYIVLYYSCINFILPYLKIPRGQEPILHALWGIQYYFLGIIIFKTSKISNVKKILAPLGIIFIILLFYENDKIYLAQIIMKYTYLLILFYILFINNNKKIKILEVIGKNTMGIFLIHQPIVLKIVSLVINRFITIPILSYFTVFFLSFLITFLLVIIVKLFHYDYILFGDFQ